MMCPDVNGDTALSNYRYFIDDYKYMVMNYDIKIPEASACSPLEYSERVFMTYNHMYVFDFVTTEAPLEDYRNLRDAMMKSIVPELSDASVNSYSKI
jgi:hypothetical protein